MSNHVNERTPLRQVVPQVDATQAFDFRHDSAPRHLAARIAPARYVISVFQPEHAGKSLNKQKSKVRQ